MFYDAQSDEQKENYKRMLKIVGSLSKLFSESDKPFCIIGVTKIYFVSILKLST